MSLNISSVKLKWNCEKLFPRKCVTGECEPECCVSSTLPSINEENFKIFKKKNGIPDNYCFPFSWKRNKISTELTLLMVWVYTKMIKKPPSHDFYHVIHVWCWTREILESIRKDKNLKGDIACEHIFADFVELVQICAMLHEINDHKYEKKAEEGDIKKLIRSIYCKHFCEDHVDMVFPIISSISFSAEKAGNVRLLPHFYQNVRDVVSDADKITALGEWGLRRCLMYNIEKGGKEKSDEELKLLIIEHYNEKLRFLPTCYIRTKPGRDIAIMKKREMERMFFGISKKIHEWRKEYQ